MSNHRNWVTENTFHRENLNNLKQFSSFCVALLENDHQKFLHLELDLVNVNGQYTGYCYSQDIWNLKVVGTIPWGEDVGCYAFAWSFRL